jgi:UPF0755 protein
MKKIIFSLLFIFAIGFAGWIFYQTEVNQPASKIGESKVFAVHNGESVKEISDNLKKNGLIKSSHAFNFYIWLNNLGSNLQAGEYELAPTLNIKNIVNILANGQVTNKEVTIQVIEGWTMKDINNYLRKKRIITDNEFIRLANKSASQWNSNKYNFLKNVPADANLEGFLFPDTYRIYKDASAADIIEKMLANFGRKLTPQMRADITKSGRTIYEIVIMASIIEKEAADEEDRPIIAGILYKRFEKGMKLEVDSTINYLTGKNNPQASYADLNIDSPYNTYKYYGLPPGPICNPGLLSLKAAIYPKESPYLFYLHRQDTGETIFSRTYNEHLRNKAKYLP